MVLLAARKSPMYLRDRLSGFLPAESRDFYDVLAPPSIRADSTVQGDANTMRGQTASRLKVVST